VVHATLFIVAHRGASIVIPFDHRFMLKAGLGKPKCESAGAGEEFDRPQHGASRNETIRRVNVSRSLNSHSQITSIRHPIERNAS
jgi:hypothetical protein